MKKNHRPKRKGGNRVTPLRVTIEEIIESKKLQRSKDKKKKD